VVFCCSYGMALMSNQQTEPLVAERAILLFKLSALMQIIHGTRGKPPKAQREAKLSLISSSLPGKSNSWLIFTS